MNSTHSTLHSRYEERTKRGVTQRKYKHIKEKARTATSMTHESLIKSSHAFTLLLKTDMFSKPAPLLMGSNPHLIKRYKYID